MFLILLFIEVVSVVFSCKTLLNVSDRQIVFRPEFGYYHQSRDIMFTQSDKYINITVNIPVTASNSYFNFYSVISKQLPLNFTTYNSTQDVPSFFGITLSGEYYI